MREAIRKVLLRLLRKTERPYECYWRDRAFKAEKEAQRWAHEAKKLWEMLRANFEGIEALAILFALAATCSAVEVDQLARWKAAKIRPEKSIALDGLVVKYRRLAPRYEAIERMRANGVPAPILFCLHLREADNSFACSLAQGDPLTHRSRNVPRGRIPDKEPPYTWELCAADAVYNCDRLDLREWKTVQGAMDAITGYNGWGTEKRGVPSSYCWGATTIYGSGAARGKYVRDGVWSPTTVDSQIGCAAVLLRMRERGIVLPF